MRVVVISDSHGAYNRLLKVVSLHHDADLFIHLGDGKREFIEIMQFLEITSFVSLAGNCDYGFKGNKYEIIELESVRLFATHGNKYNVKYGLDDLIKSAGDKKPDIILYGHTHKKFTNYLKGFYIMNPGSLFDPDEGLPSYGIIDITKAGIILNILELKI